MGELLYPGSMYLEFSGYFNPPHVGPFTPDIWQEGYCYDRKGEVDSPGRRGYPL